MFLHQLPVHLVETVLDRMVPPAERGVGGLLQLGIGVSTLPCKHGNSNPEEARVSGFHRALPLDLLFEKPLFDLGMERLEFGVRMSRPFRRANESRLIDLQISYAMAAQIIPLPAGIPSRASHGAGLVRSPETEGQAAPKLVAVLHEHPRQ